MAVVVMTCGAPRREVRPSGASGCVTLILGANGVISYAPRHHLDMIFSRSAADYSIPVLTHCYRAVFVVSGPEKAELLHTVLDEPETGLPCSRIRPA